MLPSNHRNIAPRKLVGAFLLAAATAINADALTLNGRFLSEDDHDGHDHGEEGDHPTVEWYGVFDLPATSTMYFQKTEESGNDYPDAAMAISYHACPSDKVGEACMDALKDEMTELWETEPVEKDLNASKLQTPLVPDTFIKLEFDAGSFYSAVRLVPVTPGLHVIAAQHFPIEFEQYRHYLAAADMTDLEPTWETEMGGGEKDGHLGLAFLANTIITMCTLIGVLMLTPCFANFPLRMLGILGGAFSTGTLLGACVFLILPESYLSVSVGVSESTGNAIFGVWVCSGFFIGAAIYITLTGYFSDITLGALAKTAKNQVGPESQSNENQSNDKALEEGASGDAAEVSEAVQKGGPCQPKLWGGIVWSVLVGDALHNIADGVAVAVAFKLCDPTAGWVVASGAILHELSTELGDYLVLTTAGRMKPSAALMFNFISGLTCIIGGLIASSVDMSDGTVGGLLGFSGGMYIWVCVEAFSEALHAQTPKEKGMVLGLLFTGFLLIGLVLFGHEHCEAGHSH